MSRKVTLGRIHGTTVVLMFAALLGSTSVGMAAPAGGANDSGGVVLATLYGSPALTFGAENLDSWRAVEERQHAQSQSAAWLHLVDSARGEHRGSVVDRVNRIVNRIRYVNDPGDVWQTPSEFVRNGGDCEDYAIAKYMLLRKLGIPSSSMRILGLAARSGSAAHAVLVVQTKRGPVVLDNLRNTTYSLGATTTSRMVYAVNDSTWWIKLGDGPAVADAR